VGKASSLKGLVSLPARFEGPLFLPFVTAA
jgi:hypothetical protein